MELDLIEFVRFFSKIQKINNCWEWQGSRTFIRGYGQLRIKGKLHLAHRLSYEVFKGDIPDGLVIDHLCCNPTCVNPSHLEVVTMRENLLRSSINLCTINTKKTHCLNGHELTTNNLCPYEIKRGFRKCKICTRDHDRKYTKLHRKYLP